MPFADNPFADAPPTPSSGFRDAPPSSSDSGFRDAPPVSSPQGSGDTSPLIEKYAKQYGVDPRFVHSIMGIETGGLGGGAQTATSKAGARGYMQLMPGTFKEMGVGNDITNAEQNIHAGVKYLSQQLHRYGGDWVKAAGAYNAGPGAIDSWLQTGMSDRVLSPETTAYMQRVARERQQLGLDRAPEIAQAERGQRPKNSPLIAKALQPQYGQPGVHPDAPTQPAHQNVHLAGFDPLKSANAVEHVFRLGRWAAYESVHAPLQALDAVFGAPQRFFTGSLNADEHLNPAQRIAAGAKVATHPFDEKIQNENLTTTLHKLGADRLLGWIDKQVDASSDPKLAKDMQKGLAHFAVVFGATTITDPVQGAAMARGLRMGSHIAEVMNQSAAGAKAVLKMGEARDAVFAPVKKVAQNAAMQLPVEKMRAVFGRRPELDVKLDYTGKTGRLQAEAKHANAMAPVKKADNDLVAKHLGDLTKLQKDENGQYLLPDEIRHNLLREAFVDGSADGRMRTQALEYGYEPLARRLMGDKAFEAEAAKPPADIFDYDLVQDYVPMLRPKKDMQTDAFHVFQRQYGKEGGAAFEKSRKTDYQKVGNDIADVVQRRLALRNYWKERRLVDRDTQHYLDTVGGWVGKDAEGKPTPVDVTKLSHDPRSAGISHGNHEMKLAQKGDDLATGFAKNARTLSSQSIMWNPFPHGVRNVGGLAYLAGGPPAFGGGLAYAARGLDEAQMARMNSLGQHADYLRDMNGPISSIPAVGRGYQLATMPGQKILNRLELGFRQALLDHYDRTLGASAGFEKLRDIDPQGYAQGMKLEALKADLIRRDLGDYRNVSWFVQALQAIGGPFVVFRLGTVPSAVGRSILKNPQRVESLARIDMSANADPHRKGNLVSGGVAEDFAKMASMAVPLGWNIDFMESPATAGPIGSMLREGKGTDEGWPESGMDKSFDLARQYVPVIGPAQFADQAWVGLGLPHTKEMEWLAGAPYGQVPGVSPLHAALLSLYGGYFHKRPKEKYRNQTKKRMLNDPKNR